MTKLLVELGAAGSKGSLGVIRGRTRVIFDPNRPFIGSDADDIFEILVRKILNIVDDKNSRICHLYLKLVTKITCPSPTSM